MVAISKGAMPQNPSQPTDEENQEAEELERERAIKRLQTRLNQTSGVHMKKSWRKSVQSKRLQSKKQPRLKLRGGVLLRSS